MAEVATLAVSCLSAAARLCGPALAERLDDTTEDGADEQIGLARRLLRRVLVGERAPAIADALGELTEAPAEPDAEAALRLRLRRALASDPTLLADLETMLSGERSAGSTTIIASGVGSAAAHTINGVVVTGNNSTTNWR